MMKRRERISESGGTEATRAKQGKGCGDRWRAYSTDFFLILREGVGIGMLLETILDVQIYTAKTLFIHESYLLTCWWYKISSSPP
jgi:hypothetical protein